MSQKKRVSGIVDRSEGSVVIVLVRDPQSPDDTIEVVVPRERVKKADLAEGDRVTVYL